MKTIVLIACMLLCGTASAATHHNLARFNQKFEIAQPLEDLINELIQKLGTHDPVNIAEKHYQIFGYIANFENIHVSGFSTLAVDLSVDVGLSIKLRAGVSLKNFNASVSLWESTFPFVYGKGKAGIAINDASAMVEIEIHWNGSANPSNVEISVGSADFILTGAHNDEVLSQTITDKVNHALNVVANDPAFHSKLEAYIDAFFAWKKMMQ